MKIILLYITVLLFDKFVDSFYFFPHFSIIFPKKKSLKLRLFKIYIKLSAVSTIYDYYNIQANVLLPVFRVHHLKLRSCARVF